MNTIMNKWKELYKQKLMTPEEAVSNIPQGAFIAVPLGNGNKGPRLLSTQWL